MTSGTDTREATGAPALPRVLRFWDVVFFLVVAVVGTRWIAVAAAAGPSSLTIWAMTFVVFLIPLACAVLELSARYPQEGGIYVWTREAFGEFVGFMTAWMYWTSNLVYFPGLLYFVAANALFVGGDRWLGLTENSRYFVIVAEIGIATAFLAHLLGLRVGKWLQNAGALGTWIPIVILVAIGVLAFARFGSATRLTWSTLSPVLSFKDATFWSSLAFAYSGLEVASLVAGEVVSPVRTLPRAILTAGFAITAAYLLGTLAVLVTLPSTEATGLQGILQAIQSGGRRVGLASWAPVAAALVALGGLGQVASWFGGCARLPFVAGADRLLPRALVRVHPRWGTPWVALSVQAIGAALFVFLGQAGASVRGAYDALVSMTVVASFIPYLVMFAALIRVQSFSVAAGGWRTPGGRPAAVMVAFLGLATTLAAVVIAVLPPAGSSTPALSVLKVVGANALLLSIGAGFYLRAKLRSKA